MVVKCLGKRVKRKAKSYSLVRHSSVLICLQTNCYTISKVNKWI